MKRRSRYSYLLQTLADYFSFSRMHQRGALFLLGVNLLICAGFLFTGYFQPVEHFDHSNFRHEIAMLETATAQKKLYQTGYVCSKKDSLPIVQAAVEMTSRLFDFDPNTLTREGFVSLGLSEKQSNVVINYREKGGVFRKKEDFKKMYCISDKLYAMLEPYITIPSVKEENPGTFPKQAGLVNAASTPVIYDINSVSAGDLDSIRGIGPAIANAIVKYREKLGGYCVLSQLLEVYGIDSALYQKILPQMALGSGIQNRININKGHSEDLKHPYLDRTLINLILNYRKLHGPYKSIEDLKKLALVNEELYLKLAPYLTTE